MVLSAIRTRIFRSSKDHLEIYQHYLSSTWRVASWKKPCSSGISVRYAKSNDMSLGKIGSWLTTMAGIIIYKKKETEDGDTDWTVNLLLNLYLLYYVLPWLNSSTLHIDNSRDKQHLNLHFVASFSVGHLVLDHVLVYFILDTCLQSICRMVLYMTGKTFFYLWSFKAGKFRFKSWHHHQHQLTCERHVTAHGSWCLCSALMLAGHQLTSITFSTMEN